MNMKRTHGFTLIELMVAATIGLLILAGVMQIMTNSKRTYSFQQQKARIQENARFAMDFISHGLRMAGYFGCAQGSLLHPAGSDEVPIDRIEALDDIGPNKSDALMVTYMETDRNRFAVVHCPRDETDGTRKHQKTGVLSNDACVTPEERVLTPSYGSIVVSPLSSGISNITLDTFQARRGGLADDVNILLAASDCAKIHVYRLKTVTDTLLNLSLPDKTAPTITTLLSSYNNGAQSYGGEMRQLKSERFFIAFNANDEPALYRDNGIYKSSACSTSSVTTSPMRSGTAADHSPNLYPDVDNQMYTSTTDFTVDASCYAEELVSGVESMQIRWGQDTDKDWVPNIYRRAPDVTNWSQVISAEVSLLLHTEERFDREPDTRDYSLELDPDLTAGDLLFEDHRRRTIFRTAIELRNKTLVK